MEKIKAFESAPLVHDSFHNSFASEQMTAQAERLVREVFGYKHLHAYQKQVLSYLFSGQDCIAVLPTGSGKTLCYALPAMIRPGLVLVISPLIALIRDQIRRFEELDIPCAFFDSLQSSYEKDDTWERLSSGKIRILVISPERLARVDFRERLRSIPIQMVAVDEAHCITQWGSHFRPDYRFIGNYLQEFGSMQKLAVTATATSKVRSDIAQTLGLGSFETVIGSITRENLSLSFMKTSKVSDQLNLMLQAVLSAKGQGIVYVPTRGACRDLYRVLTDAGVKCGMYHAGLNASMRDHAQKGFISGDLRVIVATHAFGMGIDKRDIRFVHHFGLPASIESYVQEIGRAGRDGLDAKCWMIYGSRDHHIRKFMLEKSYPDLNKLKAVLETARNLVCNQHGVSETSVTKNLSTMLGIESELVASCLDILFREGLLERLTTGGFYQGDSGSIVTEGNASHDAAFFTDYPVRVMEAESRIAAVRAFAALDGVQGEFLEQYFRAPDPLT
jgi:ATP-dependent DNA helicase RecQ